MLADLFGGKHEAKYANDVQVTYNPIEFKLRFRFITDGGIETAGEIVMHPMIAKAALRLMQNELANFEKANGIIYLPDDVSGLEGLFGGPAKAVEEKGE